MKIFEWVAATRNNQAGHSPERRKFLKDYRASVLEKVGTTMAYLKTCKFRNAMGEHLKHKFEMATRNHVLNVPDVKKPQDFRIDQVGKDLF